MNFPSVINCFYIAACSLNIVVAASFLILAVISHRQCFNFPTLLACNTALAIFIFSIVNLNIAVKMFIWDQEETPIIDSLCSFRAYLHHSTIAAIHHSFIIQALEKYAKVCQLKLFKKVHRQIGLVLIQWAFDFLLQLPIFLTGNMPKMLIENFCFVSITRLDLIFPMAICAFLATDIALGVIYRLLIRYVRRTASRVNSRQQLQNNRDVTMVRRIVILNGQLVLVGLPVIAFVITNSIRMDLLPPKCMRILLLLVNLPLSSILIVLFWMTPNLRRSLQIYFPSLFGPSFARVHPIVSLHPTGEMFNNGRA